MLFGNPSAEASYMKQNLEEALAHSQLTAFATHSYANVIVWISSQVRYILFKTDLC